MRRTEVLVVVLALAVALAGQGLAAAQEVAGITADQLVYQGAEVKTRVDVNGAAAVQLIGGALDAAAAAAKQQAKAMAEAGGKGAEGPMAMLPALLPIIEPAKEAIKSLNQVSFVAMKPQGKIDGAQFLKYYRGVMSGWSPLVTVQDADGTTVCVMLAPEAKGIFFAVSGNNELLSGLVTTSKPLGDLIGQIIQSGGGSLPAILSQMGRRGPSGPPPAPPAPPAKPKAPKTKGK